MNKNHSKGTAAHPRTRRVKRLFRRYAAEFLIVFIGVWLSLLAEGWRQDRVDAGTERSSLERIAQDLESDLIDLHINQARAEAGVTSGRWIIEHAKDLKESTDDLQRALSAIQFCSSFVQNPAEYLALRNSGQLNVISDGDLRRRIVARYEARNFFINMHIVDCKNNDLTHEAMSPFVELAEPADVLTDLGAGPDGLPDSAMPRVSSVEDPEALLADRAFINSLTKLVSYRNFLLSRIQVEIEQTERLKSKLAGRIIELR